MHKLAKANSLLILSFLITAMDLENLIKKHALKNALDFGKADPKSIVGKVIAEYPESKKDMKNVMKKISEIVNEVNSLKKQEIEEQIKNYKYLEKKKEDKELELPNSKQGEVVTRFPPEPSGYSHIGHAKAMYLNRSLADKYNGKMILRFDDTNPEKGSQEYVDEVKKTMDWLGIKADKEYYSSDKIPLLYEYAEKIINLERAYVCTCSGDKIKENRSKKKECGCRSNSKEENLELWKKMLNKKFKKGEAILRLKGDMNSLNTVMRDPTLFRIIDSKHYKQGDKYSVWPSYDFVVPILDSLEGVTHSLRTKEYELRRELYFEILGIFKLRKPELIEYARLAIKGTPISKRVIVSLVQEGKVKGWDDPRLATLNALKRRGVLPEAIKKFVLRFGLTKAESEPDWEILLKENRKLVDPVSNHYFFVPDPVEIKIQNNHYKNKEIELTLNPRNKNSQKRKIKISDKMYIPKSDFDKLKQQDMFALKDAFCVRSEKKSFTCVLTEYLPKKIFQWVSESYLECEVLVPKDLLINNKYNEDSLEIEKGYCEPDCKDIKIGEVVQFERFGFVRLDKREKEKLVFVYSC